MSEICGICREFNCDFTTRCRHFYHEICLKTWYETRPECPLCRTPLTISKQIEDLMSEYSDLSKDLSCHDTKTLSSILFQICSNQNKLCFDRIFDQLIRLKWDFNTKNKEGNTIAHVACKYGSKKLFERMITETDIDMNALDNEGFTPFLKLCKYNRIDIVEMMLIRDAEACKVDQLNGVNGLHIVARFGNLEIVKLLLEKGFDINSKDFHGCSPLNCACESGNLQIVEFLIQNGAKINIQGISPLHTACISGNYQIICKLIEKGADVNLRDQFNQTPLLLACQVGSLKIVQELIKNGADINVKGIFDRGIVHYACKSNNVEIITFLVEVYSVKIDQIAELGQSPLHLVCKYGYIEIANKLIELGVDLERTDHYGKTPLHYACEGDNVEIVLALVNAGANVNVFDKSGLSLANFVALTGRREIEKILKNNFTA